MHCLGAVLVGQGINVYFIRYHECRIEAQSKMTDDLVGIALVLIFLNEICCAGKCDLVDVLFHFVGGHAQTVILEGQCLLFRIHDDIHTSLIAFRHGIFSHHVQLFQLGHGIAAVRDQLSVKNIVIGIQPLFNDRKYVFTVN